MKTLFALCFCLMAISSNAFQPESETTDTDVLLGTWTLDLSPHDETDNNFATMKITRLEGDTFEGEFYREGVAIQHGQLNTQLGFVYAALVSADGTGTYNTSFYYHEGVLHGSTHAVDRNFLSVWTAKKNN